MRLKNIKFPGAAAMKMLAGLIHLGPSKTQHVKTQHVHNIDCHRPKIVPIPITFAGLKSRFPLPLEPMSRGEYVYIVVMVKYGSEKDSCLPNIPHGFGRKP